MLLDVWFGHPWCTISRFLTLVLTELLLTYFTFTCAHGVLPPYHTSLSALCCMDLPGASTEGRFRGKIYVHIFNKYKKKKHKKRFYLYKKNRFYATIVTYQVFYINSSEWNWYGLNFLLSFRKKNENLFCFDNN